MPPAGELIGVHNREFDNIADQAAVKEINEILDGKFASIAALEEALDKKGYRLVYLGQDLELSTLGIYSIQRKTDRAHLVSMNLAIPEVPKK